MTSSSPSLSDLNGDGVLDIVFGTGVDRLQPEDGRFVFAAEPAVSGTVVAVSGTTNEILWQVANPRDAFTTPRFAELNRDGVPDVVMGGREGAFSAFSGTDGTLLWRVPPEDVATTPAPYNFTTPAVVGDVDADGIDDLVVTYGGDATKPADSPRDPGYVTVISGAEGAVLAVHETPDGRESYASVVVYERTDGEWLVFGTGGETDGGAAYRAPVASLLDGTFAERVEPLIAIGDKGVIAPATLVELTGDQELDIVMSTFDGRLIVLDGASGRTLWERQDAGEETYHPAAVMRVSREGRLGLLVSRGVGVFPNYTGTVHRLHDARDGRILYQYRDPFSPAGAPLAVDLTGDGIDEPFFFSLRFPRGPGGTIHILHGASTQLITHDTPTNFGSTPVIADPRGSGTVELIGLSWSILNPSDTTDWRDLRWQLLRLDLSAATPAFRSWAGYMGTAADGRYRRPVSDGRE